MSTTSSHASFSPETSLIDNMDEKFAQNLLEKLNGFIDTSAPALPERMKGDRKTLYKLMLSSYKSICEKRGAAYADQPGTVKAIQAATAWLLSAGKPWLFLTGGVGSGKTTLAHAVKAVCNGLAKTRNSVPPPKKNDPDLNGLADILPLVISAMPFNFCSAKELASYAELDVRKYYETASYDNLIIDDMGSEASVVKRYGTTLSPVAEMLFIRYENLSTTVITSNLSISQIEQRYGLRLSDRLREMCSVHTLNIPSFRQNI